MSANWESNEEIRIFQEYLRIATVHPDVDYDGCIAFLRQQAAALDLPIQIHHPVDERKPVAVLTWVGESPNEPSIVLNSHMDVVPVFENQWTHPPFGAEIDSEGKIFARGTQDMKSVGMQYLGAIRALKRNGIRLKRTIHVIFVPDEEIGGNSGMMKFVHTDAFRALNVGFSLDEGVASPNETFDVFYAERSVWRINFKCKGTTGHGSLLLKNTAAEKVRYIIDRMMDFRENEVEKLENNPEFTIGDVTTVNLTIMKGGVQTNVLPPLLEIKFDVRIALDVDHNELEATLNRWCEEAGGDIEIAFEAKKPKVQATRIDDSNPFWSAFRETIVDDLKLKIRTVVFPGRTDSCFIREVGIPALGFSPMNNTPILLHDHDEYITVDTYLKGIEIYSKLITKVANV